MTLSEIIDLVCVKVHRTDEESRAEARVYARSRYRIIHESRPWRDTKDLMTLAGAMLTNELGQPLTDENGNFFTLGLKDQVIILPALISKVIVCRWGDSATLDTEDLATMFRINPQKFNEIGTPVSYSITSPSGTVASPNGNTLKLTSSNASATYRVSVRGRYGYDDRSEVIILAGTGTVTSQYAYNDIFVLGKDDSTYDLTVRDSEDRELLFLPREETQRIHQRIHFHSTPRESGSLLVLYKKRCRDLFYDSDTTEIEGIDNMLIAAVEKDMREGERQYGKALAKMQEITAMYSVAVGNEQQSAELPRIIPDDYHDGGWEDTWSKG